ncbi:MAG: endonuclease/exonuclease/phosphatase family protein, partial [Burkholderiales bacterium]
LLHCELQIPGWNDTLHCVNVHLGLFSRGREWQLMALRDRIESLVPQNAPLIVAGDFNDWRRRGHLTLSGRLKLYEAFEATSGGLARSFPSAFPLLRLDRIYVRGFQVQHTHVYRGRHWRRMSDHAALAATLTKT